MTRLMQPLSSLRAPLRAALIAAVAVAAGLGAAACDNPVDVANQNQPTATTFPANAADAQAAVFAAYNGLQQRGMYQRWWAFDFDARSDIGTTTLSPWGDLADFGKTVIRNPNFEVNIETYTHAFNTIARANQVIANVPNVQMDAATRDRYVAEAKFLRGLSYYHLVTLYGPNVPLILTPPTVGDRPASSDSATMFAQIATDFRDAAAVLPRQLSSSAGGRATAGAAQGMLGKALLQQRQWAAAAAALLPIVNGNYGGYALEPGAAGYARLFTAAANNNSAEVLFEVNMGSPATTANGVGGLNTLKMSGPCGPAYCDNRPTKWFQQQFTDRTAGGQLDPRLDVTVFRYKGDTTMVYGRSWRWWRDSAKTAIGNDQNANYADTARIYWKKYSEYYLGGTDQSWDANINFKVLRYADVLLMYAEALNEQGTTGQAATYVNQVRARVGLGPVSSALSQAAMRQAVLTERVRELGLEAQRWPDLGRQNLFANLAELKAHDPDFNFFEAPRSALLPIPLDETNQNPNVRQNTGY